MMSIPLSVELSEEYSEEYNEWGEVDKSTSNLVKHRLLKF